MVKAFEVAVVEAAQPTFDINTQVTTSLLFKVVLVNVAPIAVFTLFTFHW